jgi:hypothetical protein
MSDKSPFFELNISLIRDSWTRLLNASSLEPVPRVELGQTNMIYNISHPSLLLHVHDQASRNALLLLIQEVKRDIIYRRMNLPPSEQQLTDPRRITAHLQFGGSVPICNT